MKRFFLKVAVGLLGVCLAGPVMAQFNLKKEGITRPSNF